MRLLVTISFHLQWAYCRCYAFSLYIYWGPPRHFYSSSSLLSICWALRLITFPRWICHHHCCATLQSVNMRLVSLGFLCGLFGLLLYKLISAVVEKQQRDAEASRRGCGSIPKIPSDPFGLKTFLQSIKATKEDRNPQYIMNAMNTLGRNVHTVQAHLLDYELIVTRDPENINAALAIQTRDFEIGSHRAESFRPLLGASIFTSRGEAWKHSRVLMRPVFSREQISDLDLQERHVRALSKRLLTGEDGWTKQVDLAPLFYNFSLDTTTELIYGHSVHSQEPSARPVIPMVKGVEGPNRADIGHHMHAVKVWIAKRGAFWKWYWLISSKAFHLHCSEVHKYVDWFIQAKLNRSTQEGRAAESLSKPKFVFLDELAKETQNPLELRNETLSVFVAGRDTTGALLGWLFYFLARHPGVYGKLRATILAELGAGRATDEINLTKLRSCQYLQNCINETLRIAGVVPMNERVALKATTLPRGGGPDGTKPIFIPKGRQVLLANYAVQHRADIWGEDAEDFKPERWERRKIGSEFVPFGAGPRICPGRTLSSNSCITFLPADNNYRAIRSYRDFLPYYAFTAALRCARKYGTAGTD